MPSSLTCLSTSGRDQDQASFKPSSLTVERANRQSLKLSPCNSPGVNTPLVSSRRVSIRSKQSEKNDLKEFQIKYAHSNLDP
jgi:hypothetical protein